MPKEVFSINHIREIKEAIKLEELEKILEKNYDFLNVKIKKNEDSTDGNVYNVITDQNRYILKKYSNKNHAISMSILMNNMKLEGCYVPQIIKSIENKEFVEFNNELYIVYSFLEGKQICEAFGNIPDEISKKLADELKNLHNVNRNLSQIGLKNVNFIENKLRCSVLHFDLTRSNIFYNEKNRRIGFIDFDDAKYGQTIIDVAILIANLYFSKTRGTHAEGVKAFINEYYKNDEKNKTIEVPLIKETAIKWIDYILNGNEFDSSTIDSLEIRKNLIKDFNFNKYLLKKH